VGGQHEVAAALEHVELAAQRARRPAEVRSGDHVEDELRRRGDVERDRSERADPPADADVERQPRARDERGPRREQRAGHRRRERTRHRVVVLH
jgi:hypothetical protein